jgi:transcriptional regulator with AAA-type ATPase domain
MEQHAFIYLLQDGKDKGTDIYKIGMTVQIGTDCRSITRVKTYSQGTILESTFHVSCERVIDIENAIKQYFNKNYVLVRGREWFSGNVQHMRNDINRIIDSSSEYPQDMSNNNSEKRKKIQQSTISQPTNEDYASKDITQASFICKRCHYMPKQKLNLYRHLMRNKQCSTIYDNTSREELINQLGLKKYNVSIENKTHVCHICNAKFTNINNLKKHEKTLHN